MVGGWKVKRPPTSWLERPDFTYILRGEEKERRKSKRGRGLL